MKITLAPARQPIQTQLALPGSKSLTNRALLLAAFADGVSEISGMLLSDDTLAFVQALRALGIAIQLYEDTATCLVCGGNGTFPAKAATLQCRDAGTAARFLLAACAASPGRYQLDGSPQLRGRPLAGLVAALRGQGIAIDSESLPLTVQGSEGFPGGEIVVDGSLSGQFVSALLMIAPFAHAEVILLPHHPVNQPFIEMTIGMMAEFGVQVRRLPTGGYSIRVPQRYAAHDYQVEPDLSTAAVFFAAAVVTGGEITIQPVNLHTSKQGDARFLQLLQKMGCEVASRPEGLSVKSGRILHGISTDMRDCSDTFMALAAIAPFADSPTTITNIGHTRHQESDRIDAMCKGFEKIGIRAEQGPDWLRIHPGVVQPAAIDAHGDHRIAMAFAVAGLRSGVTIEGAECVSKTCPDFFRLLNLSLERSLP